MLSGVYSMYKGPYDARDPDVTRLVVPYLIELLGTLPCWKHTNFDNLPFQLPATEKSCCQVGRVQLEFWGSAGYELTAFGSSENKNHH